MSNMNALGRFISDCFSDMWQSFRESGGDEQEMIINLKGVKEEQFKELIEHFQTQIDNQKITSEAWVYAKWNNDGTATLFMEENEHSAAPDIEWYDQEDDTTQQIEFSRKTDVKEDCYGCGCAEACMPFHLKDEEEVMYLCITCFQDKPEWEAEGAVFAD